MREHRDAQCTLNPLKGEVVMSNLIEVEDVVGRNDVYCRYDSQNRPQPHYVYLNLETGTLGAEYNPNAGGNVRSFAVWYGHIRWWFLDVSYEPSEINELLYEIKNFAEVVAEGYESKYDGNNYIATFDDEAKEALEKIEEAVKRWNVSRVKGPDYIPFRIRIMEYYDPARRFIRSR